MNYSHPFVSPLTAERLRELYQVMLVSRRLDERAWAVHRQGEIAFHISAIGHEAAQAATAFALQRGVDYVAPYYRDLTLMLALGWTPLDFMLGLYGKAGEPSSGGRQMPSHFGSKTLHVVNTSAVVATQLTHAAGLAFAIQYKQRMGMVDPADASQPRLALTCTGEGATSQGDFHEAMNWAGVHKLPFICLVQNNVYAISTRIEQQMAVANVADRAAGYGVHGVVVDGTDVRAVYAAAREAVERAYSGGGPTLIEAKMYRLTPHSSDDDDRMYRSREEVESWKARDPLLVTRKLLLDEGLMTEAEADALDAQSVEQVERAHTDALNAPYPPAEAMLGTLYAPGDTDA